MASREDSHLEAQLSIAKAFTLPVFCGSATGPGAVGRPPLVGALQPLFSSSSGFRGRGRGSDAGGTWQFRVLCFGLPTAPQVFY